MAGPPGVIPTFFPAYEINIRVKKDRPREREVYFNKEFNGI
jgi:hypothetical protein